MTVYTMKPTESRRRYFGRLMNQGMNGKDRTKARKRKKAKR